MNIADKVIVVTGGAQGAGEALCRRFAADGARRVVIADVADAAALADEIGATAVHHDVAVEQDSIELVALVEREFGPIDLFCANAGVFVPGGVEVPDSEWHRAFQINFMAHVYAARALLPGWLRRGSGYFLQTASAAALLTPFGALPYAATKHADLALAESLALEYGHLGIRVSCLCPQSIKTPMHIESTVGAGGLPSLTHAGRVYASAPDDDGRGLGESGLIELTPELFAQRVVEGIEREDFMILPHPDTERFFQAKADDYSRWIRRASDFRHLASESGGR